jgi:hypothetical protein
LGGTFGGETCNRNCGEIVCYLLRNIVDLPCIIILGISDGVPVVQIGSGVVVGEPLNSGAGDSSVVIALVSPTFVSEDGAELARGVAIAVVGIGVGTCIFCAPIMVASLQERRIIKWATATRRYWLDI